MCLETKLNNETGPYEKGLKTSRLSYVHNGTLSGVLDNKEKLCKYLENQDTKLR